MMTTTDYFKNASLILRNGLANWDNLSDKEKERVKEAGDFLDKQDKAELFLCNSRKKIAIYILYLSGYDLRKYFSPEIFSKLRATFLQNPGVDIADARSVDTAAVKNKDEKLEMEIDEICNFFKRIEDVEFTMNHASYQEMTLYILWLSGGNLMKHIPHGLFKRLRERFFEIADVDVADLAEPRRTA